MMKEKGKDKECVMTLFFFANALSIIHDKKRKLLWETEGNCKEPQIVGQGLRFKLGTFQIQV